DSNADSGYSVDNLAPDPPSAFTGQYFPRSSSGGTAGKTWLHWLPSPESDFKEFQLYRGNSATFVPGPQNLVIAKADTGYIDVEAPISYYKLTSVDLHGNESVASLVLPSNVTAVGGQPAGRIALAAPIPNPTAGETELHYVLPRGQFVRLEVVDASGRRVT